MTTYFDDAKHTFNTEIDALKSVRDTLDTTFDSVVATILQTKGRLIFIAIGKSGIIADKIAASFSSVGVPSFYIDAGTAYHGDLGRVASDDLAIFISNSGETQEVIQTLIALQVIHHNNLKTVAITGSEDSTLANSTDLLLKVDVHGPAKLRANIQVQNLDDFYDVFDVQPTDPMYRAPEDRVRIW